MWPRLRNVRWLHSAMAGLEHLLFPDLVAGDVLVTNAKGVYSHSLAEYALATASWFAKQFPRWLANKAERRWEKFAVEELRGKVMGIVGYGAIGQATAQLARAYRMKVFALRRRTTLSAEEQAEGLVDALYGPAQLKELMAASDYVVLATPLTPETRRMIDAGALAAMKPSGVFINVGRGQCVDEAALIEGAPSVVVVFVVCCWLMMIDALGGGLQAVV